MKYPQILIFLTLFFVSIGIKSQHTEIINTFRPGTSQGAFSVGKNVIQFEGGLTLGRLKHKIFDNTTSASEFEYNFRAGLFKEQLEFSIQGSYLSQKVSDLVGDQDSFTNKGFPSNVIGAKYLIYDPYKYQREKSENLYSWKKNNSFQWKKLIPAVSAFAGANFSSSSSDFAFQNNADNRATKEQSDISPKIIISAQNNWTYRWVFVANIVADRFTTEFPDFRFILTSTYNLNDKWSIFGEYENANSKIYKDHLFKFGGSYLVSKDFAVDAHIAKNVKNSPSLISLNFGASYRLDYHKLEDYERIQTGEQRDIDKTVEQIKKDIEDGFLDESVMTGKLDGKIDLEEYVDEEESEEEFEDDFDDAEDVEPPKKRKWFQFWKGSGKRKARREAKKALNDTTETNIVSSKPVLGSGGRMSDFVDDEFIESKQSEITPDERTEEELAEIEERLAKKNKKKRRRKKNEPRIDPETGEPLPEPDYSGMSRKEIKAAKKQEKELRSFEDEISDLEDEIEIEQSARDIRKAQKRKEKAAKRKNKKNKGNVDEAATGGDASTINASDNSNAKKEDANDFDDLIDGLDEKQAKEEKERLRKEQKELDDLEAEINLLEKQTKEEADSSENSKEDKKEKKRREKREKKEKKKKKKRKKSDDSEEED